jgi:hypothetical protein
MDFKTRMPPLTGLGQTSRIGFYRQAAPTELPSRPTENNEQPILLLSFRLPRQKPIAKLAAL